MKKIIRTTLGVGLICFTALTGACQKQIDSETSAIHNPDINGGKILFFTTTGEYKGTANVGNLPDMVTFSPTENIVVSANEGEPADDYSSDPLGSISIIELNNESEQIVQDVKTLTFENISIPNNLRIKPGAKPAQDIEPEYVAISEDGAKAWVTLQENNGIAIVDLKTKSIEEVKSLGVKDFDRIDIDTKDGANVAVAPNNVYGLYQPDTIVSIQIKGKDYIITANEGDDREYEAWEDYAKASSLQKNGAQFSAQLKRDILDVKGKKKLRILKDLGMDSNSTYKKLYLAGTRSFSIWDAEGNQVFDSGSTFESTLAKKHADNFNTRVDDTKKPEDIAELDTEQIPYEMIGNTAYFWEGVDARSHKKGCEPEALALARIGSKIFAYIGLEKQGGFFIYDITNPHTATMVDYVNDINYNKLPTNSGDLAPEGMITFIQDGKHYLAIANELSSTISLYKLAVTGRAVKITSLKVGGFDEGAAEILAYDKGGKKLFVTNGENKTVDIIDVSIPSKINKIGSINFSEHSDSLQSVAVKDGLVAIAVE
jgi:DNA-binding beta-propeller fold protein YncE